MIQGLKGVISGSVCWLGMQSWWPRLDPALEPLGFSFCLFFWGKAKKGLTESLIRSLVPYLTTPWDLAAWNNYCLSLHWLGFPHGSDSKQFACSVGDLGLIPGLGRSPGGGHGNPLQCSCLENPHGQRRLVGCSPWGCRVGHGWVTKNAWLPSWDSCSILGQSFMSF